MANRNLLHRQREGIDEPAAREPLGHLRMTFVFRPCAMSTAETHAPGCRHSARMRALNSALWTRRLEVLGCIGVRQIRWTPSSGAAASGARWDRWTLTKILLARST